MQCGAQKNIPPRTDPGLSSRGGLVLEKTTLTASVRRATPPTAPSTRAPPSSPNADFFANTYYCTPTLTPDARPDFRAFHNIQIRLCIFHSSSASSPSVARVMNNVNVASKKQKRPVSCIEIPYHFSRAVPTLRGRTVCGAELYWNSVPCSVFQPLRLRRHG